jgi:hypothetical protein
MNGDRAIRLTLALASSGALGLERQAHHEPAVSEPGEATPAAVIAPVVLRAVKALDLRVMRGHTSIRTITVDASTTDSLHHALDAMDDAECRASDIRLRTGPPSRLTAVGDDAKVPCLRRTLAGIPGLEVAAVTPESESLEGATS